MRAKLACAAVAALTLSLSGPTLAATTPRGASVTSFGVAHHRVALVWAPTHVASDQHFTRRQALAAARGFDLVTAAPAAFRHYVHTMRRTNPSLTLLAYSKATTTNPQTASSLPESAFAHNASGQRIRTAFGVYLMEPSSAAWRHAAVQLCVDRIASSHYDGCLLDGLAMAIYSKGFVRAMPVDPDTGQLYTRLQWRSQLINLAKAFAGHRPQLTYAGNAVGNTYEYWDAAISSRPVVQSLPAALMESFMRDGHDSVTDFPTGSKWREDLAVVRDLERSGRTGLFLTKLWVSATPAQLRRWQAYAMATFLLGADGHSYFAFTDSQTKAGVLGRDLPYRMPRHIGTPTSAVHHANGTYRRHFAHGLVVVNPSHRAHSVRLHGTYRTLSGSSVTRLRLRPHSGQVLVAR